jgi:hypothetical protein
MEQLELDVLGVYAYADSAHARERELWRGFLSYALPIVMASNPESMSRCLAESIVYHFDDLTASEGTTMDAHEAVRCISTQLAKEIGVPPELALASFFEGQLPSKLYKTKLLSSKKRTREKNENSVISSWFSHLVRLQSDNRFLNKVENWKSWLGPVAVLPSSGQGRRDNKKAK